VNPLAKGGIGMTLQEAAAKYARNTEGKASKWFQNTTAAGSQAYCQGLSRLGIPVSNCMSGPGAHFAQGVQAAGAAAYQQGVAAKSDKWARNFAQAFS
jgi:hypothetical protein